MKVRKYLYKYSIFNFFGRGLLIRWSYGDINKGTCLEYKQNYSPRTILFIWPIKYLIIYVSITGNYMVDSLAYSGFSIVNSIFFSKNLLFGSTFMLWRYPHILSHTRYCKLYSTYCICVK